MFSPARCAYDTKSISTYNIETFVEATISSYSLFITIIPFQCLGLETAMCFLYAAHIIGKLYMKHCPEVVLLLSST